LEDFEEK
jgi:hypothetical protein